MTINNKLILFIFFILNSAAASAQSLTLQEALSYAMKNGEAVRKANLDIILGDLQVKEVRAGALPQIDGTVNLNYNVLAQQFILPAEFMGGEPGQFVAVQAGTTWNSLAQVQ